MKAYIARYFSSWWLPAAHYAAALGLFVALLISGVRLAYPAMLTLLVAFGALLALTAFGMLAAACVNFYKRRKIEYVANFLFFFCLFLAPAVLYYWVLRLMLGH